MGRTLRLTGRTVDLDTGAIAEGGVLRPMELRLLAYLAERPDRVIGRDELLTDVWGYSDRSRTNTLATTWYRLRQALEEHSDAPRHLFSVPGRGLRLSGVTAPVLPTTNVRPVPDDLVGRAAELAYLRDSGARLITITGPGGAGKTRLALELARHARLPGGAWIAEVAGARSEDDVVERVAAVFGVAAVDPARVGHALARRGPMLVVLDEAEAAIRPVAACARAWMADAPELCLVVTSQVPLGIPEEQRLPLDPLDLPASEALDGPAAELLLRRVHAVDPRFRAEGHERALGEVLRRLDGLPLALELAAPYVAALGAEAVASALEARDPLTSGADRPVRHRSLHAMVAWSWEGLPEPARQAVRRLLAFRRSFSIAAGVVVAGGAELTLLRERGLVVPARVGAGQRFQVLETVRAIAGDPDPDAVERYLRWYVDLAEARFAEIHGLGPPDPADDPEADELLHAASILVHRSEEPGVSELLGYAVSVAGRTRRLEARAFAERALKLELAPRARVRILHYVADSSDWDQSDEVLDTLPDQAVAVGLPEVALDVEVIRVLRRDIDGTRDQARIAVERVAALARSFPADSPLADWADGQRAYAAALVADDAEALQLLKYAAGRLRNPLDRGRAQADYAQMLDMLNRHGEAIRAYEASLVDLVRSTWFRAYVLDNLALALARAGRPAEAEDRREQAWALARGLWSTVGVPMLQTMEAEILRLVGRFDEAEVAAHAAIGAARASGERTYEAHALGTLALVLAERGAPDTAARVDEAFEQNIQVERASMASRMVAAMADLGPAPDLMERSERVLRVPSVGFSAPRLALIRAEWWRSRGQSSSAIPGLAAMVDAPDPLGLRVRLALAAISAEQGDDRAARALCSEAWAPADGRWTRIHRGRCLRALGREEAAAREVAPIRVGRSEAVLRRAVAELTRP